jgi:hypothetical protein
VFYVFGRRPIDLEACVSSITEFLRSKVSEGKEISQILLKHDVVFTYAIGM